MAYTSYLNPPSISLAGMTGSTWTTLATGVPASATGVKLLWLGTTSASSFVRGVRMNGSTDTQVVSNSTTNGSFISTPIAHEWNIGVDSSQQIQFYTTSSSPTEGTLYVMGYFGSESVFFTNAISISAMTASFATYSCTAAIPGTGIAGFFFITGGDGNSWLRQNGSTDNFVNASDASIMRHWLVGCDGSQNISGIAASNTRTLYCQGYMTAGYTCHTNAANVTPGTAGSFQNVSQAGGDTGTIVANQYYYSSNVQTIQIAGQGATTIPPVQYPTTLATGQYSAYAPSKANLGSITNGTLYEQGYFTATPAPVQSVGPQPSCTYDMA